MSKQLSEDFLARKMKMKQSLFKCLDCEQRAVKEGGTPFLFHRVARGRRCPKCNSHNLQKISVSRVMDIRWNLAVKKELKNLRSDSSS